MAQQVKNLPAMQEAQETWIWFLSWDEIHWRGKWYSFFQERMFQYSFLEKTPWTEKPGKLQSVQWVTKSWRQLSNLVWLGLYFSVKNKTKHCVFAIRIVLLPMLDETMASKLQVIKNMSMISTNIDVINCQKSLFGNVWQIQ